MTDVGEVTIIKATVFLVFVIGWVILLVLALNVAAAAVAQVVPVKGLPAALELDRWQWAIQAVQAVVADRLHP